MIVMIECVGTDKIGLGPGVGVGDEVNEHDSKHR